MALTVFKVDYRITPYLSKITLRLSLADYYSIVK